MKKYFDRWFKEEDAQSLVIVLLMLMIAVVIAVAISYRTIQDIRRAGEEKASARAGTMAESILDVITSPGTFESVVAKCKAGGAWSDGAICEINKDSLASLDYLGQNALDEYSDAGVMLRPEDGIQDLLVKKDDVLELDFSEGYGSGQICVSWEGSSVQYVMVRIFKKESLCDPDGDDDLDCVDNAVALTYENTGGWAVGSVIQIDPGGCGMVAFTGESMVARIRPYGGNASITITDLPPDFPVYIVSVKSYVYTEGAAGDQIYREFLRRVTVNPSVPAVFDYVLFDGTTAVEK